MTNNFEFNLANSILTIKASGIDEALADIHLPEGKSIAQLLYDQQKEIQKTDQRKEDI